eukprot:2612612-Amphidinium_carterae.1
MKLVIKKLQVVTRLPGNRYHPDRCKHFLADGFGQEIDVFGSTQTQGRPAVRYYAGSWWHAVKCAENHVEGGGQALNCVQIALDM